MATGTPGTAEWVASLNAQELADWNNFIGLSDAERNKFVADVETNVANTGDPFAGGGQSAPAPSTNIGGVPDDAFATTGQTTGYWDDGSKVTFYDPNSGEYVTENIDPNDPFALKNEFNFGHYTNENGDRVYGIMPTSTYSGTPGADSGGDRTEGVDPNWVPRDIPDMNGIGTGQYYDPETNTIRRDLENVGGQRTPENTLVIPPGVDPGQYVNNWQGSDSHDIYGNIIEGGPADPNSRPVYERGDPWTPINPWNPTNTGAQTGVGNISAPTTPINTNNPLQGYESSSNKDFYQQQFQDLRAQQIRNQMNQQQASQYQAQEAQPLGDPWANANLPEVFVQGAQEGWDPNARILDPAYAGMDNQQIMGRMKNMAMFDNEDRRWFDEYMAADNGMTGNYAWIGDIEGSRSRLADSGLDAGNQGRLTQIFDTLYQPAGNLPTPGGAVVPQGYASPINA